MGCETLGKFDFTPQVTQGLHPFQPMYKAQSLPILFPCYCDFSLRKYTCIAEVQNRGCL